MRLRPIGPTLLVLLTMIPSSLLGQSSEPAELPKRFDLKALDAYVSDVVQRKGLTGLSLAIVRDGKLVLSRGYGVRSRETQAPVEASTAFAFGSVTKQFACASILLLAEDGKLSIDDKVSKYFPELTRAGDVTLYQLMTHTSGYPDYYPLDFVDRRLRQPIAVDTLIREYAGGKLDFEPGTRWSYSNTGYTILGRVTEKVSGEPFGDFLRKRILSPLGMEHSSLEPPPDDAKRARGYLPFALGPPEPAVPEAGGWLYSAGGLWGSSPDLARWDIALMEGRVLNAESMKTFIKPVRLNDGRIQDYGCGVNVRREGGLTVLAHGGAISGFRATNILIPGTKSAVIVLINDEQSDPGIAQAIAALMVKDDAPVALPKVAGPPPQQAALDFLHQMQAGQIDRTKLGEEFSVYLTDDRLKGAAPRLKALGEPVKVDVLGLSERGGLEVASIRLTFKDTVLKGLMYRSEDGKIQQLLFEKG